MGGVKIKLFCRNNDESCLFKKLPFKKRKITQGLSQSKGILGRQASSWRMGSRGTPTLQALMKKGLSLAERLFTGPHARRCICERGGRGEGALASGYMVSPALAPCPWPVARSTPGLWEARGWGGGRCQPPNYSQCL